MNKELEDLESFIGHDEDTGYVYGMSRFSFKNRAEYLCRVAEEREKFRERKYGKIKDVSTQTKEIENDPQD